MRLARPRARRLGEERRTERRKVRGEPTISLTQAVADPCTVESFAATQAVPGRRLLRVSAVVRTAEPFVKRLSSIERGEGPPAEPDMKRRHHRNVIPKVLDITGRTRHAELLILCARIDFNP